jgi:hypothetical protein
VVSRDGKTTYLVDVSGTRRCREPRATRRAGPERDWARLFRTGTLALKRKAAEAALALDVPNKRKNREKSLRRQERAAAFPKGAARVVRDSTAHDPGRVAGRLTAGKPKYGKGSEMPQRYRGRIGFPHRRDLK